MGRQNSKRDEANMTSLLENIAELDNSNLPDWPQLRVVEECSEMFIDFEKNIYIEFVAGAYSMTTWTR